MVDVESAPLDQIIKQLDKLIPVVSITELDPAASRRARAAAGHASRPAPSHRGQVIQLVGVFEGKIVDVGPERLTVMLAGAPTKLDDFEDLIGGYGIVETAADRPRGVAYAGPVRSTAADPAAGTGHTTEKAG